MTVPFLDVRASYEELRDELDAAWQRVMSSGQYVLGPEVEAFETEFGRYCDAEHCVGVASGLDALELILRGFDIGPGDEVIVPSNTYVATWLAVSATGATPVPVEPDPETHNLSAAAVADAIRPRTRAAIAVHLYGRLVEPQPLREVCAAAGVRLIEDAAQAHGARVGPWRAGNIGDAAAFSFYPGKNLGAFGDGGAVVTGDAGLADRVRILRNYGSRVKYENEVVGTNSRLDPLQAAMLRVKLRHLDAWNARRRSLAATYHEGLGDLATVEPPVPATEDHVWHLYVVRAGTRDALRDELARRGVETLVHYPVPPHRSGAYRAAGIPRVALPVADRLADAVLSLPMGPHVTARQAEVVVDAVRASARQLDRRGAGPATGRDRRGAVRGRAARPTDRASAA